jgi:hypothetical protein
MRGIHRAFERRPADLEELRGFETITAEQRGAQAEFAGLLGGESGFDVVAGEKDRIGAGRADPNVMRSLPSAT